MVAHDYRPVERRGKGEFSRAPEHLGGGELPSLKNTEKVVPGGFFSDFKYAYNPFSAGVLPQTC